MEFQLQHQSSNEHTGLNFFRMNWLDLLAVQGTLKSLFQHHSSKASILWCSAFFTVQLSHPYMTSGVGKTPKASPLAQPLDTFPTLTPDKEQAYPAQGAREQGNLLFVLPPLCCSWGPSKALSEKNKKNLEVLHMLSLSNSRGVCAKKEHSSDNVPNHWEHRNQTQTFFHPASRFCTLLSYDII